MNHKIYIVEIETSNKRTWNLGFNGCDFIIMIKYCNKKLVLEVWHLL